MKNRNEIDQIAENLKQYFELQTGGEKMFVVKRGEGFYAQAMMPVANYDMPMDISISEDGEWVFWALDLCISCLPGSEQRLFTYCTRLCMDTKRYVQGTFRVHPNQALYFHVGIPSDCVLEDAEYFLDVLFYRSEKMLRRFYPTIQNLCAGRMLDCNDFYLATFRFDDDDCEIGAQRAGENVHNDFTPDTLSKGEYQKLYQMLEAFMEDIQDEFMADTEEECTREECYESLCHIHLRSKLLKACENKNVILDVWQEERCRICISLELPLQTLPGTSTMLFDCFQRIYASQSWHQGTFCIEENGKVSLRMGLDAHAALRCPQMLLKLTKDGIRLIQIYYPMLNGIARGRLLQNISCETACYEVAFDSDDDTDPEQE